MTGSVMTQGSLPRLLQKGVNSVAGEEYKDYDPEWSKIFTSEDSDKAYEVDVSTSGTGLAVVKPQGGAISYDGAKQDFTTKYEHTTYALGGIITMEAMQDNQYMDLMVRLGRMLKRSLVHTDEQIAANFINNGYTDTIGDGQALFSQSHVLGKGGTFANANSSFVALSQAAVEDAIIAIEGYTDGAGLSINAKAVSLHIPRQLRFTADRILKSKYEPESGNNAINPVDGIFPQGYHVNHRFSSATDWFIKTDVMDGLKKFDRMGYTFETDNDFGTSNYRHKGMFRVSYGCTDPRAVYGSGQ